MKIKERIKNGGFWVSLISSVFLILGAFGVEIADETASSVINAVCSALVVLGIVSDPTVGKGYLDALKSEANETSSDVSAEIALAGTATEEAVGADVETAKADEPEKSKALADDEKPIDRKTKE